MIRDYKQFRVQDVIRITFNVLLLVFMWMGQKWALYLTVTLSAIAWEVFGWFYSFNKEDR